MMDLRKVFLTATQTPYFLGSSSHLSCQKKEKSFSFTDPDLGSLVSRRATMSICSLLSSMRAWSVSQVVRKARCYCPDIQSALGSELPILLAGFHPKPHSTDEVNGRGEAAPVWLPNEAQ